MAQSVPRTRPPLLGDKAGCSSHIHIASCLVSLMLARLLLAAARLSEGIQGQEGLEYGLQCKHAKHALYFRAYTHLTWCLNATSLSKSTTPPLPCSSSIFARRKD
eukprot:1252266-Amphidinium_carterae.1